MELPEKIQKTVQLFSKLPGIGEKTALRQTLTMTGWRKEDLLMFSDALRKLCDIKNCVKCGMYSDDDLCPICQNPRRNSSTLLCVVENISDCLAIERSQTFLGKFHILFGVLNPLLGIGPDELKLDALIQRIKDEKITEVILAVNPSVEGDATCAYLKELLPRDVNINRIGFGIPMGGSLEFVDSLTISKALENRRHF